MPRIRLERTSVTILGSFSQHMNHRYKYCRLDSTDIDQNDGVNETIDENSNEQPVINE